MARLQANISTHGVVQGTISTSTKLPQVEAHRSTITQTQSTPPQVYTLSFNANTIYQSTPPKPNEDDVNVFLRLSAEEHIIVRDSLGVVAVRAEKVFDDGCMLLWVIPNGTTSNRVIGIIWRQAWGRVQVAADYVLVGADANSKPEGTLLTSNNWTNYITLSQAGEWIQASGPDDAALYSAREVYVCLRYDNYNANVYAHIVVSDGLYNHTWVYYPATDGYHQVYAAVCFNGSEIFYAGENCDTITVYYKE